MVVCGMEQNVLDYTGCLINFNRFGICVMSARHRFIDQRLSVRCDGAIDHVMLLRNVAVVDCGYGIVVIVRTPRCS